MTITFPSSWEVTVIEPKHSPPLPEEKIREALSDPVGTPPLSVLASGKRRAAIILDDITRPTPTAALLPGILDELARAGIRRTDTTVVIASGAHRRPSPADLDRKLGVPLAGTTRIIPHDGVRDVEYLGRTKRGTPVRVNRAVMGCDLRIGIGSVCPHPAAGFSGGSKILVPGVCGIETIRYLHDHFGKEDRIGSADNEFREELDDIAEIAGLDFIVNAVVNRRREIARVFAGDKTLAFRRGVDAARDLYGVDPLRDADITVVDTYPFDTSLQGMKRGFWPFSRSRPDGSRVVIGDGSMGMGFHGLEGRAAPFLPHAWQRVKSFRPYRARDWTAGWNLWNRISDRKSLSFLALCPGITEGELTERYPRASLHRSWDDLLADLARRHRRLPVRVAVYVSAPLQFPADGRGPE